MVATNGPIALRSDLSIAYVNGDGDSATVTAHPNVIEKIIEWKMGDPRLAPKTNRLSAIERGAHMQRQFTMELRVDYADAEKNEVMKTALKAAARHVYATAVLLADNGVKPQIAVHSDDFFSGHEEIKMLDDTIAQGLEETKETVEEADVSDDLLKAAAGI